jgi:alpha-glucosidase (family GH31 glycosyl hydrolase)
LTQNTTELTAYLPNDIWYDYYTGKKEATSGTEVTWTTPFEKINLHVRGGYILPQQIEGLNTILRFDKKYTLRLQQSSTSILFINSVVKTISQ